MRQRGRGHGVAASPCAVLAIACALAGCSPALDWRESRPEGSGATLLFPCRPARHDREVRLGAASLRLQLHSCNAAGMTFSLAVADGAEPAQVTELLAALRAQALANLGSTVASERPLPAIVGATPNPRSALLRIAGQRPDGRRVVADAAFFVKGLRLYQATVLGEADPVGNETLETFFASIRLP
jgi:hypothetical protein